MFVSVDLQDGVDTLRRNANFYSRDVDETQAHAAGLISEHRLAVTGRKFEANISHQHGNSVSFIHMSFNATVLVDPSKVENFALVHVPLQGGSRLFHADGETIVSGNVAGITSVASPFHIVWEPGCSQIIILIARSKLEQACRAYFGGTYKQPLVLSPEMDMRTSSGTAWRQLISYALFSATAQRTLGFDMARAHLDETLIGHLLMHHAHNYSHLEPRDGTYVSVAPKCVKLAEQYIEEHISDPLTLFDIAEYSGVTVRTLLRNFRECRGRTPMEVLRERRLEQVHQELQMKSTTSVSTVAYQWGFTHLGRFADLYRKKYGKTPSQTLGGQ